MSEGGAERKLRESETTEVPVPEKPEKVTADLLTLRGTPGSVELQYLRTLVKTWYGVSTEELFKRPLKGGVFDERTLLKIYVLTREGWNLGKIADTLDPPRGRIPQQLNRDAISQARRRYFSDEQIEMYLPKPQNEYGDEEKKKIATTLIAEQSFASLQTETRDEGMIRAHMWRTGERILYNHQDDPEWDILRGKKGFLAAYLCEYGDTTLEEALSIAEKLNTRTVRLKEREEVWPLQRKQRLAQEYCSEKTGDTIASEFQTTKNALVGVIHREGKKILEKRKEDPEWKPHIKKMTPTAAFIAEYGGVTLVVAIAVAKERARRANRRP